MIDEIDSMMADLETVEVRVCQKYEVGGTEGLHWPEPIEETVPVTVADLLAALKWVLKFRAAEISRLKGEISRRAPSNEKEPK